VGGRGTEAFPSVDPARTAPAMSRVLSSSARPLPLPGWNRPGRAVPAGHWIPYVAVDNPAVAVSQAVDLGGAVIRDKVTGPAGSSVIVADPGGALIALFTPAAG
jgi:predicted enzyme related to lactoylglutathione lyase